LWKNPEGGLLRRRYPGRLLSYRANRSRHILAPAANQATVIDGTHIHDVL
jgi:hypothetical protein